MGFNISRINLKWKLDGNIALNFIFSSFVVNLSISDRHKTYVLSSDFWDFRKRILRWVCSLACTITIALVGTVQGVVVHGSINQVFPYSQTSIWWEWYFGVFILMPPPQRVGRWDSFQCCQLSTPPITSLIFHLPKKKSVNPLIFLLQPMLSSKTLYCRHIHLLFQNSKFNLPSKLSMISS